MTASPPDAPVSLDPVDRILLHEARAALGEARSGVVIIDPISGDLVKAVQAARQTDRPIRVYADSLADERRVVAQLTGSGVTAEWPADLGDVVSEASTVLLRLPKSLSALDEVSEAIARRAGPSVQVFAAGRVKHMSHGMNRTLLRHFDTVTASLGQQKSRVLLASSPRPGGAAATYPLCQRHDDLDLTVCAHGAVFAGADVDLGTRFLLGFLSQVSPDARDVVDLGCGTGILAVMAARQLPTAQLRAVDDSRAAYASAAATATANGVADRVIVSRTDLTAGLADASVDLVLCNPPFHRGNARDSDVAFAMFADARRVLRPGGELWTVYNSHLPYLSALRRVVGQTSVVGQNPSYFVTRSRAGTPSRPTLAEPPASRA